MKFYNILNIIFSISFFLYSLSSLGMEEFDSTKLNIHPLLEAAEKKNWTTVLELYPAYYPLKFLPENISPSLHKIRPDFDALHSIESRCKLVTFTRYKEWIANAREKLSRDLIPSDLKISIFDEEGRLKDIRYLDEAEIIFSGENHGDPTDKMSRLQALKNFVGGEEAESTAILVEGTSITQIPPLEYATKKILSLVAGKLWGKFDLAHDSIDFSIYRTLIQMVLSGEDFREFGLSCCVSSQSKFSFIPDRKYDYSGWEPAESPSRSNSLTLRNDSIAKSIEDKLKSRRRVVVDAGLRHLPIFEYLIFKTLLEKRESINKIIFQKGGDPNFDIALALTDALGTDATGLDNFEKFTSHLLMKYKAKDSDEIFSNVVTKQTIISSIKGYKIAYIFVFNSKYLTPYLTKLVHK